MASVSASDTVDVKLCLREGAPAAPHRLLLNPYHLAFSCVPHTLKRASTGSSDSFRCYICLDDPDKEEATYFCDRFCCGHLTFAACVEDVRKLDRDEGYEGYVEKLVRQARTEVAPVHPTPSTTRGL